MKHFLFIFLLTCPLWIFSSCEDKLPGSKPKIFFGKWENTSDIVTGFMGPQYKIGYCVETYEFNAKGGSITELEYMTDEGKYREPWIRKLADWSYDGENIYLKDTDDFSWTQSVYSISPDSLLLGSGPAYVIYLRIKE